MEARLGQRDNPRRLLRLLGPDDRRAVASSSVAFQRQDRERARREEMLLGAPVMIALVRHRGNDGGLAIAPTVAGDARALANRRVRAVSGNQEPRRDRSAVRELDGDGVRRSTRRTFAGALRRNVRHR
jgi:hypothetical protein